MTNGLYLYCIAGTQDTEKLGNIGLYEKPVHTINFKDIGAVVSTISFKEIQPNVNEINWHQRVVEASRENWATLPVRFGTIFKSDDSLRKYLAKSYKDLRSKIAKFKNKDEYGVKVIFDKDDLSKLNLEIDNNEEIKKIKEELVNAGKGTSYFLKLRMDEAIQSQILRKIDEITGEIHRQLSKSADSSCTIRADLPQIILNSSYLVDRSKKETFDSQMKKTKEKYTHYGMVIHVSGPWAPYSFC